MRIFVTGATGFIGSAIVQDLITAGHQVLGLARSDVGAAALTAAGAQVHRGDIDHPESLEAGARAADGVIHTAFNHDFSKFAANCETDRCAIQALGAALVSSHRPLIVTSGTALLPPGRVVAESDVSTSAMPRIASEQAASALDARGVNVSVVRLPPSVHGDGDHGFVPMLIGIARQTGVSAYIEAGLNRWPAVHRVDAAALYRRAVEVGSVGARYHGVAEEGIPFRDIAAVISRRLNVPCVSMSPDNAARHFGWFAHFAAIDNPTSSQQTQELLTWTPTQPGLIADIDRPRYFSP